MTEPTTDLAEVFAAAGGHFDAFAEALNEICRLVAETASTYVVDMHKRTTSVAVLKVAIGITAGRVNMPDTKRSPRAHRAVLGAEAIAYRATIALNQHYHPAAGGPTPDEVQVLADLAVRLYAAALRAAAQADRELAGHLHRLADRIADLAAAAEQMLQAAAETGRGAHHRRPRRALAPPGRRCVARHLSAQAPPARLYEVGRTRPEGARPDHS